MKDWTIKGLAEQLVNYKDKPEAIAIVEDIQKYTELGMTKALVEMNEQAAAYVLEQLGFGLLASVDRIYSSTESYLDKDGNEARHAKPYGGYFLYHILGSGSTDKLKVINDKKVEMYGWQRVPLKDYDKRIPHNILTRISTADANSMVIFKPDEVNKDPVLAIPIVSPNYVPVREEECYYYIPQKKKFLRKQSYILAKSGYTAKISSSSVAERSQYYVLLAKWD